MAQPYMVIPCTVFEHGDFPWQTMEIPGDAVYVGADVIMH